MHTSSDSQYVSSRCSLTQASAHSDRAGSTATPSTAGAPQACLPWAMRCLRPSGRARFSLSATWSNRCPTPSTVGAATLIHRHLLRTGSITCNNPSSRLQEWCFQLQWSPSPMQQTVSSIRCNFRHQKVSSKRLTDCQNDRQAEPHQHYQPATRGRHIFSCCAHPLIPVWWSVSTK